MNIKKSYFDLIGSTPLFEMAKISKKYNLEARLLAKIEGFNPAGSIKDRVAANMIIEAEKKGFLKEGSLIIEPTSGNTGIGLAAAGRARGYHVILVMPENMSLERRQLMAAYGAKIILTPASLGMKGAIDKAQEIARSRPESFIAGQFENPANPEIHFKTTGPEIWQDTGGKVDIFVSGVGTGGTITGVGSYLKEKNENIEIVAVEPKTSAILSGASAGKHKIQGIGAGFVPKVLDKDIYDRVIRVSDQEAIDTTREILEEEGLLTGISSGAAVWAAIGLAKNISNKGKTIVVILPDSGERYLSAGIF